MAKLEKSSEEFIWNAASSYLENGRKGWDIPHTLAAVHWMRELLKHETGNEKILVTTMYLHDIGIVPFDPQQTGLSGQLARKRQHMELGAQNTEDILRSLTEFSNEEKKQIIFLVSIHDDLSKIKGPDAQLVFEADCLGQIDRNRVKSTMSPEESRKFLEYFQKERLSLFKTKTGIRFAEALLRHALTQH